VDISIVPPSYCVEIEGNLRETEEWRLKDPFSFEASTAAAAPVTGSAAIVETNQEIDFLNTLTLHPVPIGDFDFSTLGAGQKIGQEEEDFGDFSAAPEPPPPPRPMLLPPSPPPPAMPSFQSSPSRTPPTAISPRSSTKGSPHSSGSKGSYHKGGDDSSIEKSFRKFLSLAAPNVAHVLEEQDASLEKEYDVFGDFTDAPIEMLERIEEKEVFKKPVAAAAAATAPAPLSPFLRNFGTHSSNSFTAHTNGKTAKESNAVQEYGVAWTIILTTAAEKLEVGRQFWENSSAFKNNDTSINIRLEILEIPRVQQYFAALGRVYYVASLVRLSAEMLGLLHFVRELEIAWNRCYNAWSSTISTEIKPLNWVSREAANKLRLGNITTEIETVEASVGVVLPTLSSDEFPRMLAWSEGLDSVLLLPLSILSVAPSSIVGGSSIENGKEKPTGAAKVVEWPEGSGRLCLSAVANFWLGCVSPIPPELE
jgi:hypothetical protein